MPDDLVVQLPVLKDVLRALKIPTAEYERYEADDVLATLARRAAAKRLRAVIVTTDKDLLQVVDATTALAFVVPSDARLRAELYAPSRAVGFVAVGEEVVLRYEPYPYQKFGHYRGTVEAVSRTSWASSARLDSPLAGEPLYEVIVALRSQTVTAYGQERELRAGMAVEADVLLETRRLYEWVLEPLYSLRGKIR